jgi:hypothetical protein
VEPPSRNSVGYVRFAPESGHCSAPLARPLSAKNDRMQRSKYLLQRVQVICALAEHYSVRGQSALAPWIVNR